MTATAAKPKRPSRSKTKLETSTVSLAPTAIDTFPFARIRRAPENVRHTDQAEAVEELADDIAAHGLLQSLIGYAGSGIDAAVIYIVGGGRRLQALNLLHERGTINDEWPVPVLVRDPAEAIELSLSENLARRNMNPADEFIAFAALMKSGATSPAELAKRFGFTEQYVKQRLRFAALHPDVLEALREGKISLVAAVEYAKTDDPEIQVGVYRALMRGPSYNRDNLWHLKSMLSSEQLRETSAVFRFIDRVTYEKEGGGYVEDLFEDTDERGLSLGRRLSKSALARMIADRCLQFQASVRVEGEAKRAHPTVVGHVIEPITFGAAKAPAGYVKIEGGWNSTLSTHVNVQDCWKRADQNNVPIQVGVGIGEEPLAEEDDDGSERQLTAVWRREYFFVPKEEAKRVLPPKNVTTYGGTPETPEQRRENEINRLARVMAARLVVPKLSSVPGLEGRCFYENDWVNQRRKPGSGTMDQQPCITINVFVSDEEIQANLERGRELAIEQLDAIAAERAAREKAKQDAANAKAAAFKGKLDELRALASLPAVIMASQYDDDELAPWFRWKTGEYFDLPEDHADASDAMGVADLNDLAENMAVIGDFYATLADYEGRAIS